MTKQIGDIVFKRQSLQEHKFEASRIKRVVRIDDENYCVLDNDPNGEQYNDDSYKFTMFKDKSLLTHDEAESFIGKKYEELLMEALSTLEKAHKSYGEIK